MAHPPRVTSPTAAAPSSASWRRPGFRRSRRPLSRRHGQRHGQAHVGVSSHRHFSDMQASRERHVSVTAAAPRAASGGASQRGVTSASRERHGSISERGVVRHHGGVHGGLAAGIIAASRQRRRARHGSVTRGVTSASRRSRPRAVTPPGVSRSVTRPQTSVTSASRERHGSVSQRGLFGITGAYTADLRQASSQRHVNATGAVTAASREAGRVVAAAGALVRAH
jgi:hypothetical protein